MRTTVRLSALLAVFLAGLCCVLVGCSSSSSGPSSVLDNYYIAGEYLYCPAGDPPGVASGAFVWVRDGGADGQDVDGLNVTFNGAYLEHLYAGYYWNPVNVAAGGTGTFAVSTGSRATVSESTTAPYAPFSLTISGGEWDASEYTATNQISWQNPATRGDNILVAVYDWDGGNSELLYNGYVGDSAATTTTISNQQLSYFQGISSIRCVVYQTNGASFEGQPGGSYVMIGSGTSADWNVNAGARGKSETTDVATARLSN